MGSKKKKIKEVEKELDDVVTIKHREYVDKSGGKHSTRDLYEGGRKRLA